MTEWCEEQERNTTIDYDRNHDRGREEIDRKWENQCGAQTNQRKKRDARNAGLRTAIVDSNVIEIKSINSMVQNVQGAVNGRSSR